MLCSINSGVVGGRIPCAERRTCSNCLCIRPNPLWEGRLPQNCVKVWRCDCLSCVSDCTQQLGVFLGQECCCFLRGATASVLSMLVSSLQLLLHMGKTTHFALHINGYLEVRLPHHVACRTCLSLLGNCCSFWAR